MEVIIEKWEKGGKKRKARRRNIKKDSKIEGKKSEVRLWKWEQKVKMREVWKGGKSKEVRKGSKKRDKGSEKRDALKEAKRKKNKERKQGKQDKGAKKKQKMEAR